MCERKTIEHIQNLQRQLVEQRNRAEQYKEKFFEAEAQSDRLIEMVEEFAGDLEKGPSAKLLGVELRNRLAALGVGAEKENENA